MGFVRKRPPGATGGQRNRRGGQIGLIHPDCAVDRPYAPGWAPCTRVGPLHSGQLSASNLSSSNIGSSNLSESNLIRSSQPDPAVLPFRLFPVEMTGVLPSVMLTLCLISAGGAVLMQADEGASPSCGERAQPAHRQERAQACTMHEIRLPAAFVLWAPFSWCCRGADGSTKTRLQLLGGKGTPLEMWYC